MNRPPPPVILRFDGKGPAPLVFLDGKDVTGNVRAVELAPLGAIVIHLFMRDADGRVQLNEGRDALLTERHLRESYRVELNGVLQGLSYAWESKPPRREP